MERVYKLTLATINQALTITSLEVRLPRFLCKDYGFKVIKVHASYFDNIENYEDWNLPNDGIRDRLKKKLFIFSQSHLNTINDSCDILSPFGILVILTLTESVAWVEDIIKFIDDTYKELSLIHISEPTRR